MKKNFIIIGLILSAIMLAILGRQVINRQEVEAKAGRQLSSSNQESDIKLEVFYFHRTQRCSTCRAIGRLTGELIKERFYDKLSNGSIIFREINVELPENRELANKFQANGPSLFFNVIKDGKESIVSESAIWRYTGNEDRFKGFLETRINELLS